MPRGVTGAGFEVVAGFGNIGSSNGESLGSGRRPLRSDAVAGGVAGVGTNVGFETGGAVAGDVGRVRVGAVSIGVPSTGVGATDEEPYGTGVNVPLPGVAAWVARKWAGRQPDGAATDVVPLVPERAGPGDWATVERMVACHRIAVDTSANDRHTSRSARTAIAEYLPRGLPNWRAIRNALERAMKGEPSGEREEWRREVKNVRAWRRARFREREPRAVLSWRNAKIAVRTGEACGISRGLKKEREEPQEGDA